MRRTTLLLALLALGASALLAPPRPIQLALQPGVRHTAPGVRHAAPVEPEIPVAASEVRTELTEEQRAALQAFAEIDVDGDGELTADEIYQALSKRDASVSLERVAADTTMLREQVGGIEARLDEMARSFERLSKQLANG